MLVGRFQPLTAIIVQVNHYLPGVTADLFLEGSLPTTEDSKLSFHKMKYQIKKVKKRQVASMFSAN